MVAVEFQHQNSNNESSALVAVEKGMVLHQPMSVAGRQIMKGRLSVGNEVLRTTKRRIKQPLIANPSQSSVLELGLLVQPKHYVF